MVKRAWNANEMSMLFDLLKWYSLLDVLPFLEAVLVYLTQYKARGLDLFKTAISLPGISIYWAFDTISKENKFHLFPPRHTDIGQIMRRNLTGGPSIIFHRHQVKDVSLIRNNPAQIVKSIVGYDTNALYLWCMAQNMPMERARVYRLNSESKLLEKVFNPDVSEKQNVWLTELVCKYPDLRYAIKKTVNSA